MSRYARNVDANHRDVVEAFEAAGVSVLVLSGCRAGAPDLAVGVAGRTHLVEVKPDTHLKRHQPTDEQQKFAAGWRGAPVYLVRSPQQAMELVATLRQTSAVATKASVLLAKAAAPRGGGKAAIERASAQNSQGAA